MFVCLCVCMCVCVCVCMHVCVHTNAHDIEERGKLHNDNVKKLMKLEYAIIHCT